MDSALSIFMQKMTANIVPTLVLSLSLLAWACQPGSKPLDQADLKRIANTYGQFAPEDAYLEGDSLAYYGSENEWSRRQFSKAGADRLYKRRGQRQMLELLEGDAENVIRWCGERLTEDPEDAEQHYMITLAYTRLGRIKDAERHMTRALELGLPPSRFLAGPRSLITALSPSETMQQLLGEPDHRLVHGPMLGQVTATTAALWVRTWERGLVQVLCYTDPALQAMVGRYQAQADEQNDYVAKIPIKDLEPATDYYYSLQLGSTTLTEQDFHFRTATEGEKGSFRVAFGGGAGYTPWFERMWDTIARREPDALFLLGDNVYIDIPEMPGPFHNYTYYRRQSQPSFARLIRRTAVYTIWDDHDAATDDVWLGPYVGRPEWKVPLMKIFQRNWNNPPSGHQEWPGGWYKFSRAGVEFFMLDGRMYRTNPFGSERTMLGPVQKAWLLEGLQASEATFKVLVSPVPWTDGAKPGSHDTWSGYAEERAEILDFLTEHQIEGALLMSADRHRTDYWKIPRSSDYPLYEFTSSKLTNVHTHDLMPGAVFGYNDKCSFGLLDFDTTLDDPTATFRIVSIDNELIHTVTIPLSELAH